MSEFKEVMNELIHELGMMDIEGLRELKKEWIEEMEASGVDERVRTLCIKTIELVIEKKECKVASFYAHRKDGYVMDIQEEVRINRKQPCIVADSEQGMLLKAIKDDFVKRGFSASINVLFLMSAAYNSGLVHGKRIERARRKNEGTK